MKNYQLVVLIVLFTGRLFAFSDKGVLPEGREWRECRVGMVIDCNILECDSICAAKLAEEKEEKDRKRLEELVEQSKNSAQPEQSE